MAWQAYRQGEELSKGELIQRFGVEETEANIRSGKWKQVVDEDGDVAWIVNKRLRTSSRLHEKEGKMSR